MSTLNNSNNINSSGSSSMTHNFSKSYDGIELFAQGITRRSSENGSSSNINHIHSNNNFSETLPKTNPTYDLLNSKMSTNESNPVKIIRRRRRRRRADMTNEKETKKIPNGTMYETQIRNNLNTPISPSNVYMQSSNTTHFLLNQHAKNHQESQFRPRSIDDRQHQTQAQLGKCFLLCN